MEILIVDDERAIRDLFTDILRDEGHQTATAADGKEAITLLLSGDTQPNLILIDLNMPVMDGIGFLTERQRRSDLQAIPVILISATAMFTSHAETLGVDAYLTKPVELDDLLQVVAHYST